MANVEVGTKFKHTEKGLKWLALNCFGEGQENCEEMKYERKYNLWKVTGVYTGYKDHPCYSAERMFPEGTAQEEKGGHEDFIDDALLTEFDDDNFEIVS